MEAPRTEECTVAPPDADPVSVSYRVAGDGPPVVLLHGIGLDASHVSWAEVLPALAEDYTVYAPDFPGHGESDKPRADYSTAYYEAVLSGLLDELDLVDPRLVGVSMGGAVALSHALNGGNPERLVLVNSYGLTDDAPWRLPLSIALRSPLGSPFVSSLAKTKPAVRTVLATTTAGAGVDESLVEDVYQNTRGRGALRAMRRWQRKEFGLAGFRTDGSPHLEDLEVPTLLVQGAADPVVSPAWSKDAAEQIPDGKLALLEGAGHWVPREAPGQFLDATTSFLS
ncbi:alpha/beta fold hydrolase [Halobacteriales archaeon Cl-PHB]